MGIRGVKKHENKQKSIIILNAGISMNVWGTHVATILRELHTAVAEKLGSDQPKKLYGIISFRKNTGFF